MKASALLLVPVLLVAACGGGSSSLSKKAYLAKAEAICSKANADRTALTTPTSAAAVTAYVSSVLDIATKATDQLAALDPPAADKAELDKKVIQPLRAQLTVGRAYEQKVKAAVASNNQQALGALLGNPPVSTRVDAAFMTSYGLTACVKAASPGK